MSVQTMRTYRMRTEGKLPFTTTVRTRYTFFFWGGLDVVFRCFSHKQNNAYAVRTTTMTTTTISVVFLQTNVNILVTHMVRNELNAQIFFLCHVIRMVMNDNDDDEMRITLVQWENGKKNHSESYSKAFRLHFV